MFLANITTEDRLNTADYMQKQRRKIIPAFAYISCMLHYVTLAIKDPPEITTGLAALLFALPLNVPFTIFVTGS